MLMHDYEGLGGGSLVMTDANEFFFYKSQVFQLLVQNELIFNLWVKWMKPVLAYNTFS